MRKPELQRIETTLGHLPAQDRSRPQSDSANRSLSFTLSSAAASKNRSKSPETVQPFPVEQSCPETPFLPKFKLPSFSSHRHVSNPGLAIGLLKEIESTVTGWQTELQQILLQIQAIYLEGPIVDGWLESHPHELQSTGSAMIRHADINHLMDYVEQICGAQPAQVPSTEASPASRTDYRLCGLDADGQFWSRPCPPDQVPYVSLAIARYQKLRQLLGRRQDLESRLSQLAKTLIDLHGQL